MRPSVVADTGTLKYNIPMNTFMLDRGTTGTSLRPNSRNAACNKGPFMYTTIDGMFSVCRGSGVVRRMRRVAPCLRRGLSRVITGRRYTTAEQNVNFVRKVIVRNHSINRIMGTTLTGKLLIVSTNDSMLEVMPPLIVAGRRVSGVTTVLSRYVRWF